MNRELAEKLHKRVEKLRAEIQSIEDSIWNTFSIAEVREKELYDILLEMLKPE